MTATTPSPAPAAAPARPHPSSGRRWLGTVTPYLYLVPMVAFVGVFLLYPAAETIRLSFTAWDGIKPPRFVGLENYVALAHDPAFLVSVINTVYWVAGIMIVQVGIGLAMAVLISVSPLGELFKRIVYLPATVSGAAIGVVWFVIYNPQLGILNNLMRWLHLDVLTRQWLADPPWNTFAMIVAGIWQGLGPTMILFLVGLQSIPQEPLEAARMDGAGAWRLFWHITLPLLRPMTVVVVAISLINSFKVFDIIWVMTQGGPYRSSETLAVTMYRSSFVDFQFGYGSAVAVVLTLIVFVVSVPYIRNMFTRIEVS